MEFKGRTSSSSPWSHMTTAEEVTTIRRGHPTINELSFLFSPDLSPEEAPFQMEVKIRSNYALPFSDVDFYKPLKIKIENVE